MQRVADERVGVFVVGGRSEEQEQVAGQVNHEEADERQTR